MFKKYSLFCQFSSSYINIMAWEDICKKNWSACDFPIRGAQLSSTLNKDFNIYLYSRIWFTFSADATLFGSLKSKIHRRIIVMMGTASYVKGDGGLDVVLARRIMSVVSPMLPVLLPKSNNQSDDDGWDDKGRAYPNNGAENGSQLEWHRLRRSGWGSRRSRSVRRDY